MDKVDVGTVVISTSEYIADKFRIFELEEELKKQKEDLSVAIKCYGMVADAVRQFVRKDSDYGKFTYIDTNTRELLNSIGEDAETFDLTVRPKEEEEIFYGCKIGI